MKILLPVFMLLIGTVAMAQQENQYTQFMYNTQQLNPAYTGSRYVPSFLALYRKQWFGFEGAPQSQLLSFNTPFFNRRVGFGVSISHHSIGIVDQWYANLAYSYGLIQNEDFSLRFGIQGSLKRYSIDFQDPGNRILIPNDPSINNNSNTNELKGNFGAGLYLTYHDSYFGFSVPSLLSNTIGINGDPDILTAEERPHFYVMGGIMIPLGGKIHLKPAVLAKYVTGAPVIVDANLSVFYDLKVSAGLSYRHGAAAGAESIDLLLFYQLLDQLGVGVSYDFTLSKLRTQNSGSLEIMLRYDLKNEKNNMTNPRFFF